VVMLAGPCWKTSVSCRWSGFDAAVAVRAAFVAEHRHHWLEQRERAFRSAAGLCRRGAERARAAQDQSKADGEIQRSAGAVRG
jgi:hypothetical protein